MAARRPLLLQGFFLSWFRIAPIFLLVVSAPLFLGALALLTLLFSAVGFCMSLLDQALPGVGRGLGNVVMAPVLFWALVKLFGPAVQEGSYYRSFVEGSGLAVVLVLGAELTVGLHDTVCCLAMLTPAWVICTRPHFIALLQRAWMRTNSACTIGLFRPFDEAASGRARRVLAPTLACYGRLVVVANTDFQRPEGWSFLGWGPQSTFAAESAELLRDETWKEEIAPLVDDLDYAVFDITNFTPNIAFELELVTSKLGPGRVVFVCYGPVPSGWREYMKADAPVVPIDLLFAWRFPWALRRVADSTP